MNDLIERRAAIKAVVNGLTVKPSETVVRKIIKAIPAADNWIPVKERLPEEYTEVLITYVEQGVGAPITVTGELDTNGNWYSEEIGSIRNDEVTAWKPLPEPYKEDNK